MPHIIIRDMKITQVRVQMVVKLPREGPQGYRRITGGVSPPPTNSFMRIEQAGDTEVRAQVSQVTSSVSQSFKDQ